MNLHVVSSEEMRIAYDCATQVYEVYKKKPVLSPGQQLIFDLSAIVREAFDFIEYNKPLRAEYFHRSAQDARDSKSLLVKVGFAFKVLVHKLLIDQQYEIPFASMQAKTENLHCTDPVQLEQDPAQLLLKPLDDEMVKERVYSYASTSRDSESRGDKNLGEKDFKDGRRKCYLCDKITSSYYNTPVNPKQRELFLKKIKTRNELDRSRMQQLASMGGMAYFCVSHVATRSVRIFNSSFSNSKAKTENLHCDDPVQLEQDPAQLLLKPLNDEMVKEAPKEIKTEVDNHEFNMEGEFSEVELPIVDLFCPATGTSRELDENPGDNHEFNMGEELADVKQGEPDLFMDVRRKCFICKQMTTSYFYTPVNPQQREVFLKKIKINKEREAARLEHLKVHGGIAYICISHVLYKVDNCYTYDRAYSKCVQAPCQLKLKARKEPVGRNNQSNRLKLIREKRKEKAELYREKLREEAVDPVKEASIDGPGPSQHC